MMSRPFSRQTAAAAAEAQLDSRRRVVIVDLVQGVIGLGALLVVTILRFPEARKLLAELGSDAWILILIFFLFASVLQMLKFELTNLVFVSLSLTAYIAMYPILGMTLSAWIAVAAAMITRFLGIKQIGPVKIDVSDPLIEYLNVFRLFATYGIPVMIGAWLYEFLGGSVPVGEISLAEISRLTVCSLVVIAANSFLMDRVMAAWGYTADRRVTLIATDSSIYLLTLPYAITMTLAYRGMGWGAVLALAFTGIVANLVARNLAATRTESRVQLQRLASLSNIGKTISLRFTTEELLTTIYTECRKVVDVSLFSIALFDEQTNELCFELDIRDDTVLPKDRISMGEGLNSWVITNHRPLLLGSVKEERQLGLQSLEDGKPTESWLGVPMIARDRAIGVISIQSYRKHAFNHDDVLLLTSIANQAAVALENANLYKDLEGLTYALEQRVLDRTNELREANLRLLAADRSKSQFLANMSHELRTPLNSVIGFSSVLLDNTEPVLPSRLYKFLENIRTAGNHLLELINDILDLSKIEAGKMELRPEWFEIRDTVASVERVMRGLAAEAGVSLKTTVETTVPLVRLDEGRVKQILFNLLSNAVKFSPGGGPVELEVARVDADASPLEMSSIRMVVRDHGIGIDAEHLARIFDEFYQTDEGRKTRKGGTGLGLSLTRSFVELHHGEIEVQSQLGKGSTFRMVLPVDYYEAAAARGSIPSRSSSSPRSAVGDVALGEMPVRH
ncbi:MAG: ATP-binding protein [Thermoanaerobaculia bacterium]